MRPWQRFFKCPGGVCGGPLRTQWHGRTTLENARGKNQRLRESSYLISNETGADQSLHRSRFGSHHLKHRKNLRRTTFRTRIGPGTTKDEQVPTPSCSSAIVVAPHASRIRPVGVKHLLLCVQHSGFVN